MAAPLRHLERLEWFRAYPEEAVGVAEELLRYDSPVRVTLMRLGLADTGAAIHLARRYRIARDPVEPARIENHPVLSDAA